MNNDPIKQTFETLTPTSEQKSRMLNNILDQIDTRSASADLSEPQAAPPIPLRSKRRHTKQWLGLAASIALVIGLSFSLQQSQPAHPQGNSPIVEQQYTPIFETLEITHLKTLKVIASGSFEVIHTLDAPEACSLVKALSTSQPVDPTNIDFEALGNAAFVILNLELIDGQQFQLFYTPTLGILDCNSQYYKVSEETAAQLQHLLP